MANHSTLLRVFLAASFCFLAAPLLAAESAKPIRVGLLGLDTSHVLTFAKAFNDPNGEVVIVAAFPGGSPDIELSWSRVEKFTKAMKDRGIEICDSVEDVLEKVDAVMITSVDGRPHLEYARKVLPTGKPTFIDKPVAGSLVDVCEIYALAEKYNTPCFCTSALRYDKKAAIKAGKVVGDVLGCSTYSPATLEEHHPDFYWYGVHGVEPLFAVMGTGIDTVSRTHTADADVVVGVWKDGRIGVFRGTRKGPHSYGGTAFGTKKVASIGKYDKAKKLCKVITKFFKTKQNPFPAEETLEIYAFMTAADASKEKGGCPVKVQKILAKAKAEAAKRIDPTKGKTTAKKVDGITPKENWVSLFDGKTLDGWHQVGDGKWVVEDGSIVGKTDKAAKLYGHLVSNKKYKNFKVRLKFKSIKGNSGFYIRGYMEKPDKAHGLQVEVDPRNNTGGIYESYKRRWVWKPTKKLVEKSYKLDQWNELEVVAKDGYVTTHLNGIKVAELLNDPVQEAGNLIFQMHAGSKILVYYKDIEIVELP